MHTTRGTEGKQRMFFYLPWALASFHLQQAFPTVEKIETLLNQSQNVFAGEKVQTKSLKITNIITINMIVKLFLKLNTYL